MIREMRVNSKEEVLEQIICLYHDVFLDQPYRPYGSYYVVDLESDNGCCSIDVDTTKATIVLSAGTDDEPGIGMGGAKPWASTGEFLDYIYKKLGF